MITVNSTDDEIRAEARDLYEDEGQIDIDEEADIIKDEEYPHKGAHVCAWVWVYFDLYDEDGNEVIPDADRNAKEAIAKAEG